MIQTDQTLVALRTRTSGKIKPLVRCTYGTLSHNELSNLDADDQKITLVIGVVLIDPASKCYKVKTDNGISELKEWLS